MYQELNLKRIGFQSIGLALSRRKGCSVRMIIIECRQKIKENGVELFVTIGIGRFRFGSKKGGWEAKILLNILQL